MNRFKALTLCLFAVPAVVYAANAAPLVKAGKESCANIQWNPDFLQQYPTAPAACRGVTVQDGVKYATFNGKVSRVGHDFVQVEVSDVYNNPISMIAFQLGVGGRITVQDKAEPVPVKDLKVGDHLTFWVREGRFGVSPTLTDQPMPIVKPEGMPAN